MVCVPKADGTTRSCGEYAVTVNPQLSVPQYPIPLPEDVFVKLRGEKRFTKLDLKNAYQQLPLDPDSPQFVTINSHRGLHNKRLLLVLLHPWQSFSGPWTSFFKVLSMLQPLKMTF